MTRGPGLASAVNGIAHAALDRLPVVVIADTVRRADAGRISHQRLNHAALGAAVAKAVVTIGRDLIKIKQRPAGQGGPEAVDFGPVSYARAAQALGAAAVTVSTETDLAAALSAASGRDGPMVIDVQVDPAGYPAIMELSRGEAGRAATIAQQL